MLQLNLQQLITARGIANPNQFLIKGGFTYYTAHLLLRNEVKNISFKHAEQLCLLLNCSINDLFTWQQPAGIIISEDHPLQNLKPKPIDKPILEHLRELPLDKLEELKNYIENIQKK